MRLQKLLLFTFFTHLTFISFSQLDFENRFKNIVPPSPNQANLINIANFPKSNFTGVPEINIPVYNIKLKDFNIPIELQYSAGGIKVNDMSSWVGLGWNLSVGGSITRTVNGNPDDIFYDEGVVIESSGVVVRNKGYLVGGLDSLLTFNDEFINDAKKELKKSVKLATLNGFAAGNWDNDLNVISGGRRNRMDMLADNFYINLLGQSYKLFFYKKDINSPVRCFTTPYSNIVVNYTLDSSPFGIASKSDPNFLQKNRGIMNFTIIDGQGNKYFFDQCDSGYQVFSPCFYNITEKGSFCDPKFMKGKNFISTWNLSNIITNNNDTITFSYQMENILIPSVKTYKVRGTAKDNQTIDYFQSLEFTDGNPVIKSNRLYSIETKNEKISFIANQAREDLKPANALKEINIQTNNSLQQIKKYKFHYDYYTSGPYKPSYSLTGNISEVSGDLNKRLKLIKFEDISSDNKIINPYNFTYTESPLLPAQDSKEQDFWGYYNGNHATTLVPSVYIYPDYSGIDKFTPFKKNIFTGTELFLNEGSWNRNSNSNFNQAGILKTISYPTGGSEEFIYESNSYDNPDWGKFTVGGLRIQQIIKKDNIGATTLNRYYDYTLSSDNTKSSGKLLKFPLFAHVENTLSYEYNNSAYTYNSKSLDYYKRFTFRNSHPSFTSGENDGAVVGYSEVTETDGNGKSVYKYSVPKDCTKNGDVSGSSEGNQPLNEYCDGLLKKPETKWVRAFSILINGTSIPKFGGNFPNLNNLDLQPVAINIPIVGDYYPFSPTTNYSWNRGLLLSETIYNTKNKKISERLLTYGLPSLDSLFYIPSLFITYSFNDFNGVNDNPYGGQGASRAITIFSKYYGIANASKLKITETQKFYSDNDQASYLTNLVTYSYHVDNRLLKLTTKIKSNGSVDKIIYNYPFSSSNLSAAIKNELLVRNYKEHLIETEYLVNNISLNRNNNTYAINPLNNKLYISKSDLLTNNILSKSITIKTADKYNNISSVADLNNQISSFIWDSKGNGPIAKCINASASDIGATSFEADQKGNLYFTGIPILISNAPTGKMVYPLSGNTITKSVNTSETYIISLWATNSNVTVNGLSPIKKGKILNSYTYYEFKVENVSLVSINGDSNIDELRIYPLKSKMDTYTYEPLTGISSKCDENNVITYYEYDNFQRLSLIRDQDKNILKKYCYSYAGQPENCSTTFYNTLQTGNTYTRSNCGAGYTGGTYVTAIAANTFSSTVSVIDANQQTQNYISTIGQSNANQYGNCLPLFYNTLQLKTFKRNNCGTGYIGSAYEITVAANTYSSLASVADANLQAQNYLIFIGQRTANMNGTCTSSGGGKLPVVRPTLL